MSANDVVFLSGVRTAFGTFGGALKGLSAIVQAYMVKCLKLSLKRRLLCIAEKCLSVRLAFIRCFFLAGKMCWIQRRRHRIGVSSLAPEVVV